MAKQRTPVLKVTKLSKAYGSHPIVSDFNLEVWPGDAIALTGRNGAGKSTILRCIIGADKADSGTIEICGNRLRESDPAVRRDLATVIDDLDFFPDLSVVEHLDLLARAHGLPDAEGAVDDVLHEVQLVAQSGQLPGTLSSGQRRRLALATASYGLASCSSSTSRSSGSTSKVSSGWRSGSRPSARRAWR